MELVRLTKENIEAEHVCCALSEKAGAAAKKAWLSERMENGYTFLKLAGPGKVFLEYGPAEHAWAPVSAGGYLYIDCFWVSGRFAGQGYARQLLNACVADAKGQGKNGVVALSSQTKKAFLSDPGFYKKHGFLVADTAPPYYELLYLPFAADAPAPKFRDSVKNGQTSDKGLAVYYTDHCPWNEKYIPLLAAAAQKRNAPFRAVKLETEEQAQGAPNPFATYAVFYDGEFVTNEMFSDKKLDKFLAGKGY